MTAVVLLAAALHAVWNALAHGARDQAAGFGLLAVSSTVCAAVLVVVSPVPPPAAWPFIVTSAVLQAGYLVTLLVAYRLGDFAQAYPVARGTAPLLVAVWSAVVLREPTGPLRLTGVVVISAGLLALALTGRPAAEVEAATPEARPADAPHGEAPRGEDAYDEKAQVEMARGEEPASGAGRRAGARWGALGAAGVTGVLIAAYTVVDGTGVRHSDTVVGYVAWGFLLQGPLFLAVVLARRGPALLRGLGRRAWVTGLAGGALSFAAYGLVVWAQSRADLATVSALRETSILFAALIGAVWFRERLGLPRLAASAVVVLGIAMVELAAR